MKKNRLDTADACIKPSITKVLVALNDELNSTRVAIKNHIDNDPDLKKRSELLDSISRVGEGNNCPFIDGTPSTSRV